MQTNSTYSRQMRLMARLAHIADKYSTIATTGEIIAGVYIIYYIFMYA